MREQLPKAMAPPMTDSSLILRYLKLCSRGASAGPGCTRLYQSCTFRIFTPEIHSSALAGCFEYNIKTFQKLYRLYLTFSLLSKYFLQRVSTDMARPQNRGYNSPTFGQFELRASNRHREMHLRGKIRSGTTDGTTFYNSLLEKLEQLLILCHCTARIQLQGNLRLRWAPQIPES